MLCKTKGNSSEHLMISCTFIHCIWNRCAKTCQFLRTRGIEWGSTRHQILELSLCLPFAGIYGSREIIESQKCFTHCQLVIYLYIYWYYLLGRPSLGWWLLLSFGRLRPDLSPCVEVDEWDLATGVMIMDRSAQEEWSGVPLGLGGLYLDLFFFLSLFFVVFLFARLLLLRCVSI